MRLKLSAWILVLCLGGCVGVAGATGQTTMQRAQASVARAGAQGTPSVKRLFRSIRGLYRSSSTRAYGFALAKAFLDDATEVSSAGGVTYSAPTSSGCWYVPYSDRSYDKWVSLGITLGYINKYHDAVYCGNGSRFDGGQPLNFSGQTGTQFPYCFGNWNGFTGYQADGYAASWKSANLGIFDTSCASLGHFTRAELNVDPWGTYNYNGTG